jgi:hypothetical protein
MDWQDFLEGLVKYQIIRNFGGQFKPGVQPQFYEDRITERCNDDISDWGHPVQQKNKRNSQIPKHQK